jgi:DNA-binding beta-propeller fold protein YncE
MLAVTDATAGEVALVDPRTGRATHRAAVSPDSGGLAWQREGNWLWVAERLRGTLAEVDGSSGRVLRRVSVTPRPQGLALAPKRRLLVVTDPGIGRVSFVDSASGRALGSAPVGGQPGTCAVTPDEALAVVPSLLPSDDASNPLNAAAVSLLSLGSLKAVGRLRLPAGSALARGVAISPDSRWAYVAHTLGRTNIPTTQLDQGWVNTNALSVLDLRARRVYATVLLDRPLEGAADPWGCALSRDGATLWVTLSGVHQMARIDLRRLHELLAGRLPNKTWLARPSAEYSLGSRNTWLRIAQDPERRSELSNDLTALQVAGVLKRWPLPCVGPRGLALSPDGGTLAVAGYFSGTALLCDAASGRLRKSLSLGAQQSPGLTRRGERTFHDATYAFQGWLSCATCHPEGARADGMNWDMPNDGLGNPKNTKSLLLSHRTPPMMWHGVREDMEQASVAGFRFIHFREPGEGEAEAVQAYVRSLRPEPSPYLGPKGQLTTSAVRGRALFLSPRTRCATCHPGPLYTDLRPHDVGARDPLDTTGDYYTPLLVEAWRTAPYLHDGSATTMEEVLTTRNRGDRHGVTSQLTPRDVSDLAAYLRSL